MAHKSDRRLYLNAEGKVVDEGDPSRVTLLVGKGGEIPMEEARRYGLVGGAQEAPTAPPQPQRTNDPALEVARPSATRAGQKKD